MIFASEVDDILCNEMPLSLIDGAVEHYTLGGFHANVDAKQRQAFKAWVANRNTINTYIAVPAHPQQLDFLGVPQNDI